MHGIGQWSGHGLQAVTGSSEPHSHAAWRARGCLFWSGKVGALMSWTGTCLQRHLARAEQVDVLSGDGPPSRPASQDTDGMALGPSRDGDGAVAVLAHRSGCGERLKSPLGRGKVVIDEGLELLYG